MPSSKFEAEAVSSFVQAFWERLCQIITSEIVSWFVSKFERKNSMFSWQNMKIIQQQSWKFDIEFRKRLTFSKLEVEIVCVW